MQCNGQSVFTDMADVTMNSWNW